LQLFWEWAVADTSDRSPDARDQASATDPALGEPGLTGYGPNGSGTAGEPTPNSDPSEASTDQPLTIAETSNLHFENLSSVIEAPGHLVPLVEAWDSQDLAQRVAALEATVAAYDPYLPEGLIVKGFEFADHHHLGVKRKSGEPYIVHPVSVAATLAGMRLDHQSIITALLHDTVEDTEATSEEIAREFGPEIAELVDGVTKLSQVKVQGAFSKSAENFRKLFLAMSKDIRVLMVKLADRLDNMRTIQHLRDDKRRRISLETAEIYAPLAERIGLRYIKEELDDIAFQQLNPEARANIIALMGEILERGSEVSESIIAELMQQLKISGVAAEITGRVKTPYSIWQKMQRKSVNFEQLSDIVAFRVVVESIGDAYHALGVLHSAYPMVPGRFKDYISTPKNNGYRSIHTGLIGPFKHKIEVQIRTRDMHLQAERGVAAHWKYKQSSEQGDVDGMQFAFVRELREILDNASSSEEFLEHTKMEMYQDQVFVFTPKGMLIVLPQGACIVDFAYAVHTAVGNQCIGGKVNGSIRPLSYSLQNGDQVEILTKKNAEPRPDWEVFAVTGKAKAQIRRFIRSKEKDQHIAMGKMMVHRAFRAEDLDFTEDAIAKASKALGFHGIDDLYAAVSMGNQTIRPVVETVHPGLRSRAPANVASLAPGKARGRVNKEEAVRNDFAVPIRGLVPGLAVHMAKCCHPIPGDPIVGIITTGKGVTVHTRDCDNILNYQDQPERFLAVSWDIDGKESGQVARLEVIISNEPGSLGTLSTLIGKNAGNIINLKFTQRSHDFFTILLDIEVKDLDQLNNVIASLRASRYISQVERSRR
jgi:GTP pyrophosphokinase